MLLSLLTDIGIALGVLNAIVALPLAFLALGRELDDRRKRRSPATGSLGSALMLEPQVQVRFPCERCEGTKRVIGTPPPGTTFAPGSETEWCRACKGTGVEKDEWVPVSEFRARFLG